MGRLRLTTISARPSESRSSVANCWNKRTGSVALSTAIALVRRLRRVRAAAAARITRGADVEELAFVVFANAENIQADLVHLLDALEQLAHAIDGTCRGAKRSRTWPSSLSKSVY